MKCPPTAAAAFQLAAAELGMCGAARLFTRELLDLGGESLLAETQEQIGASFPVFDSVAGLALQGEPPAPIDSSLAVDALGTAETVLVIGLEALFLDELLRHAGKRRIGLVLGENVFGGDWTRILANFNGLVENVALDDVHRWAGRRSALLTFLYGTTALTTFALPVWSRVAGPDVRPHFRSIVGWDVLGRPTTLYPRWLVECPIEPFSSVVS